MVWVAVADVGLIVDVLQVDDERVSGLAMDGASLQEGDVVEGRRCFPGDVQLVLLIDLCLLQLVFLRLADPICDVGPYYVLIKVDFDFSGVVGVVERRGSGADGPHGPVVLI